jgi:hypothetical protein
MGHNVSRRQAVRIIGAGVAAGAVGLGTVAQAEASQATAKPSERGTAHCSIQVEIIVEGLAPKLPGQYAKVYKWEITSGDKSIWQSDRTSNLVPNEYGVARALAGIPAHQFLLAFDPNTTVGDILTHPDQQPPRYWEANVFEAGSSTKVLLNLDVDMGAPWP